MKIFIILIIALTFLFSSYISVHSQKDKRNTVGRKMLEIERELGFKYSPENKKVLDNLLDMASESIEIKENYTKEEAIEILKTIDGLLKDYTYYANNNVLGKALSNKRLDCNLYSLLYLHITDYLKLPLFGVVIPKHAFVRWSSRDYEIFWETTIGHERSEQYYIDSMNVRPEPIESGCYMENIAAQNIIGLNIYELLPVNNSDLNDKYILKASKLMPKYSMLTYALGMNNYNNLNMENAEKLFVKALKSNPYNVAANLMMSRLSCEKSDFATAKKYLSAAEREVEIQESNKDISNKSLFYTVYGEFFRYRNMNDSAIIYYRKALKFNEENSEAKRKLSVLDGSFNEINLSDPVEIYNKLAACFNSAKYEEALLHTGYLLEINYMTENVHYMKAMIHLNLKDTASALISYSKVIKSGKNSQYKFNSLYNRGVVYYQRDQFKKALSDFQAALKINDPAGDQLRQSLRDLVKDCKRRLKGSG